MITFCAMNQWRFKLLYDGACPLCQREAHFLQRRNRHGWLAFEDITAPGFDATIYHTTQDELMGVIHGVFPDGRHRKEDGPSSAKLIAPLGLAGCSRQPAGRACAGLVDKGYEWFARNRMTIGRHLSVANAIPVRASNLRLSDLSRPCIFKSICLCNF
ncbi:MAG: DUF393 domain-containing protein [Limisphaerales bacterium]